MKIDELQQRLQEINDEAQALRAQAEAEKRDLSEEERRTLDSLLTEFDVVSADIQREERLAAQTAALAQGQGRKTAPNQPAQPSRVGSADDDLDDEPAPISRGNGPPRLSPAIPTGRSGLRVPAEPATARGNWGWRSAGHFALGVAQACRNGGTLDPRLERQLAAASTYGSEGTGADGGFAVPPDFRDQIMQTVMGEASLLPLCDQVNIRGNSFTCPKDETTPWQSTGGIQAYWDGEVVAATQSKPALGADTVKAHKVRCLVPVTEELLEDAPAMDSYIRKKAPEKIAFKVSLAILRGTGAGQPLGVQNSPCLVSVAKESGQQADTLVAMNVIKMYSRMYGPYRSGAVWLVNQDLEPQLFKLSIPGTDNTGNFVAGWGGLVYLPANGLSGSPYGTLFGRPVIPHQACETLGDQGDLFFANFKQYLTVLKTGENPRVETSMHLWFDQDLMAFKFVLRVGGQPWWSAAVSARDGSATYSPFVTLDERA